MPKRSSNGDFNFGTLMVCDDDQILGPSTFLQISQLHGKKSGPHLMCVFLCCFTPMDVMGIGVQLMIDITDSRNLLHYKTIPQQPFKRSSSEGSHKNKGIVNSFVSRNMAGVRLSGAIKTLDLGPRPPRHARATLRTFSLSQLISSCSHRVPLHDVR